mgnify:CR=1 FL=1
MIASRNRKILLTNNLCLLSDLVIYRLTDFISLLLSPDYHKPCTEILPPRTLGTFLLSCWQILRFPPCPIVAHKEKIPKCEHIHILSTEANFMYYFFASTMPNILWLYKTKSCASLMKRSSYAYIFIIKTKCTVNMPQYLVNNTFHNSTRRNIQL